jgi:hypothetical protein
MEDCGGQNGEGQHGDGQNVNRLDGFGDRDKIDRNTA